MLIYQQNGNVLPRLGEPVKSCFNGGGFGLLIDDEKVLLGVWSWHNMLRARQSAIETHTELLSSYLTPTPARRRPVTESCERLAGSWYEVGRTYLVTDDGKKLPVLVGRGWSRHCVFYSTMT